MYLLSVVIGWMVAPTELTTGESTQPLQGVQGLDEERKTNISSVFNYLFSNKFLQKINHPISASCGCYVLVFVKKLWIFGFYATPIQL